MARPSRGRPWLLRAPCPAMSARAARSVRLDPVTSGSHASQSGSRRHRFTGDLRGLFGTPRPRGTAGLRSSFSGALRESAIADGRKVRAARRRSRTSSCAVARTTRMRRTDGLVVATGMWCESGRPPSEGRRIVRSAACNRCPGDIGRTDVAMPSNVCSLLRVPVAMQGALYDPIAESIPDHSDCDHGPQPD